MLDQFTTAHMTRNQANRFMTLMGRISSWSHERKEKGLSLILCGSYGIGKTYIAKYLCYKNAGIYIPEGFEMGLIDGSPNYFIKHQSRFIMASELMAMIDTDDNYHPSYLFRGGVDLLVIDDVGKEGNLRYIAKDSQVFETQSRYYDIVNYVIGKRGNKRPSIIITTNLEKKKLNNVFNDATMSRLNALAPAPYIFNMNDFPDYRKGQGGR